MLKKVQRPQKVSKRSNKLFEGSKLKRVVNIKMIFQYACELQKALLFGKSTYDSYSQKAKNTAPREFSAHKFELKLITAHVV